MSDKIDATALVRVEEMTVYPNPTHELVNIRFISDEKSDYDLTMINTIGKTVKSQRVQYEQGENFITVPTNDLPQGIYFIKMSNGKSSYTQKLIIE